jgi:RNA polymerase sigma-70 factor (ECF subfamily)
MGVTPPELSLAERISQGDGAALGELMRRHAPSLLRFAGNYLDSSADADEVVQDTFIRAERAMRRGIRPGQMEAWLYRIALNRCRSRLRRRWPFVSGPKAGRAIAMARSAGSSDAMEWREEIAAALAALSPVLREAFLLKHVEGLDYVAMATVTGAGVPALKMRVARACEELRSRLKEVRG